MSFQPFVSSSHLILSHQTNTNLSTSFHFIPYHATSYRLNTNPAISYHVIHINADHSTPYQNSVSIRTVQITPFHVMSYQVILCHTVSFQDHSISHHFRPYLCNARHAMLYHTIVISLFVPFHAITSRESFRMKRGDMDDTS